MAAPDAALTSSPVLDGLTPPAPLPAGGPPLAGKAHAPWSEVILLACLSMFGSVSLDMYLPALPGMARALHASTAEAQSTVSVFLLGLAVGQLVVGPLSDRFGRRLPILGGAGLYCLASGLCAISTHVGLLVGARLLQALAACAGSVVARAVVRDRYDDHEVLHVLSLLSLVFGVAPVLAPLVGGWVLGVADWRWIFGVQALFGLAAGTAACFLLPESRSEATRLQARAENAAASYLALLRQPLLIGYLLTGGLAGAALFSYITSAPRMVIGEFHIAPARFGWVFGANAIGLIGAGQVNARLARRIPADTLVQAALLAALAAATVLATCAWTGWGGMWGVLAPLFVVISGLGFSQPNTTAAAMAVDRRRAGATAALIGTVFFGVGSLSGVATSLIPGRASVAMACVIIATLVLSLASYRVLILSTRTADADHIPSSS
ncbi:multidrug effflux MFS transporter [Caulobacter sp. S45]|uniref:multidrug effflux MFS transporter n=1 Tax=Caulobacter sp. S45 TaxID=1641861 RepID=UPI0015772F65|nr:multidrug effflux MFS transporter [Caulobacter sp. S45]